VAGGGGDGAEFGVRAGEQLAAAGMAAGAVTCGAASSLAQNKGPLPGLKARGKLDTESDLSAGSFVRILTRYILGEILSLTLIGCALFTFILFMPQLPHILEVVVRNSSTLTDVAQVFLFTLPNLFKVTIPMAVLWGMLLGLSRLAADSEIIAMRASGLGIGYFVRVASIVAVTAARCWGWATRSTWRRGPTRRLSRWSSRWRRRRRRTRLSRACSTRIFKNFVLYVQDVRSGAGAANWRQVFMADVSDPVNPLITTAASATVVNDNTQELMMRLRDGVARRDRGRRAGQSNISTFTTTDMPLALNQQSDVHLGRLDTKLLCDAAERLFERTNSRKAGRQAATDRDAQPVRAFPRRAWC
jgi:hypothetical protein